MSIKSDKKFVEVNQRIDEAIKSIIKGKVDTKREIDATKEDLTVQLQRAISDVLV